MGAQLIHPTTGLSLLKKPTENHEVNAIADDFTGRINEDRLISFTDGSKNESGEAGAV